VTTTTTTATIVESNHAVLQDAGRPAGAKWAIAANGALDQFSYHLGNALVGNPTSLASLETILSDLVVRFDEDVIIAVTGAHASITIGGVPANANQAIAVPSGRDVAVRGIHSGVRTYLSVHGGFIPHKAFLGSISPDRTLGFGLDLTPGTILQCNTNWLDHTRREYPFPTFTPPRNPILFPGEIGVLPGENCDMFHNHGQELFSGPYTMTERFDAVGARLTGPIPSRITTGEILSRALPIGAIEVAGGNEILVLNRGRGLSAGYPVVGVIAKFSMDEFSQTLPGDSLQFVPISLEDARRLRIQQSQHLQLIRQQMRSLADTISGDSAHH